MNEKVYWAAKPGAELAQEAYKRVTEGLSTFDSSGQHTRIRKINDFYYGETNEASSFGITPSGERGELSLVYVNMLRFLVQRVLSLVTGQRLAFQASPKNTDVRSKEDAIVANGLLAGYVKDKHLDRILRIAAEYGMTAGEGFVRVTWDTEAGEPAMSEADPETGEETGRVIKDGDIRIDVYSVLDITRDETRPTPDLDWVIVRDWVNRYDLMAQYPELADKIQDLPCDLPLDIRFGPQRQYSSQTSDLIPVYVFYHTKTPAMPDGREMAFLDGETFLYSGPLPYKRLPVFRIAPADMLGTPRGYSPVFDLLVLIESYNALLSTGVSNQLALGVTNITSQRGNGIDTNQLVGGLNVIEYDIAPPAPLQLAVSSPELFNLIEIFRELLIMMMGQNDTSLGKVDQRLSGSAMALLDSKALEFVSVFQESYTYLAENVGQAIVETLQLFAKSPRVGMLIGKNQRFMLREFSASSLEGITRVTVDVGNPMARTPAQRVEIANQMASQGLIRSSEQYIEVLATGQVENLFEGPQSHMLLIKSENEMLAQGQEPPIMVTDNDMLHLQEHRSVLDDPSVRTDPTVLQAWTAHTEKHVLQMMTKNPILQQAFGESPAQGNQQMQAEQAATPDPSKGGQQAANTPDLPEMPEAPQAAEAA